MSIAHIGIGSNLGQRRENCLLAIELIERKGITVKKRSSIHETEPWGVKDQPLFLNMAIEVETDLAPIQLLRALKDIEREMGRRESYRWGPRVLDLDILLFEDVVENKDDLRIPHPLMHVRDFVLRPLQEIAPDAMHPVLKMSVRELFCRLAHKPEGEPT